MKKILIVYATAGAGHKKAAEAVKNAFDSAHPDADIKLIDSLDYAPKIFRFSYPRAYLFLVNNFPNAWGFFYYLLDHPFVYKLVHPFRRITNWLNSRPLVAYLLKEKPDVIISTHFFASEVISHLRLRRKLSSRLITCITDFRSHAFWVAKGVNKFTVASEDAKKDLVDRGMPESDIEVLGIPIDPIFNKELNVKKSKLFTILLVSGGFGVGPIKKLVNIIDKLGLPVRLLVVCGKNKKLCGQIRSGKGAYKIELEVYGFVDNMHELMELSDLIITKSGGMTASEALAKRLPMIIVAPIPGQEKRNSRFLVSRDAAIELGWTGEARKVVKELFNNRDKLRRMQEDIDKVRKPNSAGDIVEAAWKI